MLATLHRRPIWLSFKGGTDIAFVGDEQLDLWINLHASDQTKGVLQSVLGNFQGFGGGLKSALGLGGIGGGALIGLGAGTIVAGGALAAGASLVSTYRDEEKALKQLSLAYQDAGIPFSNYQGKIQDFLDQNRSYISDINAVRDGFAALTRAGIDQNNVFKAVNDALDLSTARGIDFGTALQQILLGLEGNARGLKVLGIQVKDYGDLTKSNTQIQKDDAAAKLTVTEAAAKLSEANRALYEDQVRLHDKSTVTASDLLHEQDLKAKVKTATDNLQAAQAHYNDVVATGNNRGKEMGEVLDTIHGKVGGARSQTDSLTQAQDRLGASWERLANDTGPAILSILTLLANGADLLATGIDQLSHMSGPSGGTNVSGGKFAGLNRHPNSQPANSQPAMVRYRSHGGIGL